MGSKPSPLVKSPYRIWVIGEFARFARRHTSPFITLTQANFVETLASLDITVVLTDPSAGAQSKRHLTIPIAALADFTPPRLARHVPSMAPLMLARDIIVATQNNALGMDPCRTKLADLLADSEVRAVLPDGLLNRGTPSTGSVVPVNDKPGSLFDLIEATPAPPSKSDELISVLLGTPNRADVKDTTSLETALRRIDARLAELCDALLAQPILQKTESAWRGLAELVRHLPRDKSVELRAVHSDDEQALETLSTILDSGDDHALPSLVLFDRSIDNTQADMTWLDALSRQAQSSQLPCIVSLNPSFFGAEDGTRLARSEALSNRFDSPKFELWNALRNKDRARWVACAHNRFLQRAAFASASSKPSHLWGAPGWLIAALAARSVGSHQWPTQIYQPAGEQIEDLPLHQLTTASGDELAMPLENRIDDTLCNDLALQGILALQCVANRDRAFITRAPSLLRARRYNDASVNVQSQIMSSFPYQMLTARLAQLIQCNRTALLGDRHPAEVNDRLETFLLGLLRDTGAGAKAEVQMMADPDNPSRMMATVNLQFGRKILSGADIELTFPM